MGKGGQKVSTDHKKNNDKTTNTSSADYINNDKDDIKMDSYSLSHLTLDELKYWGKAYAINVDSRSKKLINNNNNDVDVDKLNKLQLLQCLEPLAGGILDSDRNTNNISNLPLEKPPFTLSDIQKAIPKHCFKHSYVTSFSYLLSDIMMIACFGYLCYYCDKVLNNNDKNNLLPPYFSYLLWPGYWYAQGSVMTGVWVIAHECGHGGFTASETVNHWVGTILHSALLVPFHSWRITHKHHHENTGSCENDEVFAPSARKDFMNADLRETPLAQAIGIIIMLTVGWLPGYLVWNFTGPEKYRGKNANHFSPDAVLFSEADRPLVRCSIAWWMAAFAVLVGSVVHFGVRDVLFYYWFPLMVTNYHLVLITYLQHTDVYMPHFRGEEWSFLRGALCTVDRSFGPVLDHTFHHITDTHVCHHLFSKMPFYHAAEATEAFKGVLGEYYLKDNTPIARALYRSFSNCQFVEDEGNIVFYKNKK